jgi:hypothetical protein
LFAKGGALALEKLKYSLESCGKRRQLRGEKMRSSSIIMRDEGFKVGY